LPRKKKNRLEKHESMSHSAERLEPFRGELRRGKPKCGKNRNDYLGPQEKKILERGKQKKERCKKKRCSLTKKN